MNIEIVTKSDIDVCGLQTELTVSQIENYQIIRAHWKNFNNQLRILKLKSKKNWEKFGVITKVNGSYWYLSAILLDTDIIGFKNFTIGSGKYAKFCHQGNLQSIRFTIHDIYRIIIPKSKLKIDMERSFIHFEHYDQMFHWSSRDSIIEIYVPLIN